MRTNTTLLTRIIILVFLLPGCSLLTGKSDPPKCNTNLTAIERERAVTRILGFGDGFGADRAVTILKQARKSCDMLGGCHFGLYLGDVYLTGANSVSAFEKKILTPLEAVNFHFYLSLGNHEYRGNVQKYYDLIQKHKDKVRMPCNQYQVTDDATYTFRIVDSNHYTHKGQPAAMERMCNAVGFRAFVGHHPLWSNAAKKRNSEEKETRKHFESVMRRCSEAYFAGHDHHQELIVMEPTDKLPGIVQVVEGGGGRSLRDTDNVGQYFIREEYGYFVLEISHEVRLYFFDDVGKLLLPRPGYYLF